jgi:hypothetical protein
MRYQRSAARHCSIIAGVMGMMACGRRSQRAKPSGPVGAVALNLAGRLRQRVSQSDHLLAVQPDAGIRPGASHQAVAPAADRLLEVPTLCRQWLLGLGERTAKPLMACCRLINLHPTGAFHSGLEVVHMAAGHCR